MKKVYILMGEDLKSTFLFIVYAATLYENLKSKIMKDYKHDYPYLEFYWVEEDLIEPLEENDK